MTRIRRLLAILIVANVGVCPSASEEGGTNAPRIAREKMKVLVKGLAIAPCTGLSGGRFPGVPDDVDQVQLVMEIMEDKPFTPRDRAVRSPLIYWLTSTKDSRAEDFALGLAMDENEALDVRGQALFGLAGFCPDKALPALRTLMDSPNRLVRDEVAHAILNLARPEAEEMLAKLMNDSDPDVQARARTTLYTWRSLAPLWGLHPKGEPPPPAIAVHPVTPVSGPSVGPDHHKATKHPAQANADSSSTMRWAAAGLLGSAVAFLVVVMWARRSGRVPSR